jgi:hypothetical protein
MKQICLRIGAIGALMLPYLVSAQMPGTGRVHIKSIRSYSGVSPLPKPTEIVVYTSPQRRKKWNSISLC